MHATAANIPNMPTESILGKSINPDAGKMYLVDKNQPRVLNYLSEPTVDEKHQQQETTEQTEQTEQPQISANLTDYITNLLDNQFNKDIQDLKITAPNEQTEETITLHGRITNTPDVVESEPVKGNPSVYLDKDGKAHRIDENGNEVKNDLSIWDNIYNKTKEISYNTDSLINKPSDEIVKRKTDILLDILTAPMGLGKTVTTNLATKLTPLFGKKISQAVVEGIGNGIVGGATEGITHSIENKNDKNPLVTVIEDIINGVSKGAIDGYTKGTINNSINPNDENYIELLKKLIESWKK